MELVLYENKSDMKVVTKNIETLTTLTGTLRENCSVINPVITVESINNSIAARCNYAKIAQFGRYYYVTDIIFTGLLYEIHMHVDVLMTYKDGIRQQNAVVARQEATYNMYLDDGWFMSYQNPYIQTKVFSNPTPFETQEFVLVIAGS